jgi:hypothetical protein
MAHSPSARNLTLSCRRLVRRALWRRAVVSACLPYVVLSVFVDFVHVHPRVRVPVPVAAAGAPNAAGSWTTAVETSAPDYSCPVCQWLRAGPRPGPQVALESADATTESDVAPNRPHAPQSPVPHPDAFRGPPSAVFG